MNDKSLNGGYLLYSKNGEDFCELGTMQSASSVEFDTTGYNNGLIEFDSTVELVCKFSKKQCIKLEKALGLYKYTFRKVRKGKRIVRILV